MPRSGILDLCIGQVKGVEDVSIRNETTEQITITPSSGNVFADLGLKNADTLMAKSVLAIHIKRAIKARGLTQSEAAALLGLDQPKVSAITSGRLEGFSTDRLLRFLNELGCDVQISVSKPHPETRGSVVFV